MKAVFLSGLGIVYVLTLQEACSVVFFHLRIVNQELTSSYMTRMIEELNPKVFTISGYF